ncbi:unnamed protein product [Ectocarpus sp. 4 AP-2014]
MPSFMDTEAVKGRRSTVSKILNDKQFGEAPKKNWSESKSIDDDNGEDGLMSSGSSNVSVEESAAPSDIGSQESGEVDSGDVESGDVVFAKEIRGATFGGWGAGRKKTWQAEGERRRQRRREEQLDSHKPRSECQKRTARSGPHIC